MFSASKYNKSKVKFTSYQHHLAFNALVAHALWSSPLFKYFDFINRKFYIIVLLGKVIFPHENIPNYVDLNFTY